MASDHETDRSGARGELEVAWYTKELGRPLQRKLLQRRLDEITHGHATPAASKADGSGQPHDRPRGEERPR